MSWVALTTLACTLEFAPALAQDDNLYFKHFSVEQGLSHNDVTSIIQDSIGFMWYGTKSGLNKFDGYNFTTFRHDPKSNNSLSSDDIACLSVDKSGIIWIGTKMNGVNRLDPYTETFKSFRHDPNDPTSLSEDVINAILVDTGTHWVWIGTASKGLDVLKPSTKLFVHFRRADNPSTINSDSVACVKSDGDGNIWIGSAGGVNVYNPKTKSFASYRHDSKNTNSLSSDDVRDIFIDREKQVWIATANGLTLLNPLTNAIKVFRHDDRDPLSVSSNDLTSVYQDKAGKIWVGTRRNGLSVYNPSTQSFTLYSREAEDRNSLSSDNINSISQGRSGMFWAATKDGGLNAFNPKSLKFKILNPSIANANINCVFETTDGTLRLGLDDGLVSYELKTSLVKSCIKHGAVTCVASNTDDALLIGTKTGLWQYDVKSSNAKTVVKNIWVTSIAKKSEGLYWIGTQRDGLFLYNEHTGSCDNVNAVGTRQRISSLYQDGNGKLWVGTFGDGVFTLDNSGRVATYNTSQAHSLGSNYVNAICADNSGRVWVSTWTGGLNGYNVRENNFTCLSAQDGLPSNSIGNFLCDVNNNMWLGTDVGICRLTVENNRVKQARMFDGTDGLPSLEFYNGVALKCIDGDMLFASSKGLVVFNPDSLRNNPYKPPVVITDFQVFNKSVLPGDSTGILQAAISVTPEIHLKHTQNVFSFLFTAISFINAEKNSYAYMMEGFDKSWIYTDASKRIATYTNLPPGSYSFHVKASNNDGTWNDEGTSVKVVIAPPFYMTWWFVLLCVVAAALLVYGIYRYRLAQVLKMQNVRNKIASDLHDDIGSGLSSISIFSEIVRQKTGNKAEDVAPFLEQIDMTSRSLSEAIHDIVWTINPNNDKFNDVVKRMKTFATEVLTAKNVRLNFDVDDHLLSQKIPIEKRKNFYLIFKEAVNNVAKYSAATNVDVRITSDRNRLNMSVSDNGNGFDLDNVNEGNGLVNMKRRADEMGGYVKVETSVGHGTTIKLAFKTT